MERKKKEGTYEQWKKEANKKQSDYYDNINKVKNIKATYQKGKSQCNTIVQRGMKPKLLNIGKQKINHRNCCQTESSRNLSLLFESK